MPKQLNQIIGSFIFRNEADGCLTSKYHHADSPDGPFSESCKLITESNSSDNFLGTYRTTWLDDRNSIDNSLLIIERNVRNINLFRLTWQREGASGDIIFEGSGMIFGEFLVGAYWDH
jgi:hypothetical protein